MSYLFIYQFIHVKTSIEQTSYVFKKTHFASDSRILTQFCVFLWTLQLNIVFAENQ